MPPVTITSAFDAYERVLAEAGVTVPVRDAVDARAASEVRTNAGCIPDHPNDVGGWPPCDYAERPADRDTDHDGMPNDWEASRGSDPNSAADGPQDADGDGYANVEEYLNELAGNAPPPGGGTPPPQVGSVQRTAAKRWAAATDRGRPLPAASRDAFMPAGSWSAGPVTAPPVPRS